MKDTGVTLFGLPIYESKASSPDAVVAVEFGPVDEHKAVHIRFTHSERAFFWALCRRCGYEANSSEEFKAHDCAKETT